MIKHQVKVNFHFGEWFLKPIFLNNYVVPDGSAKITQFTFLFASYRNIVYSDGTKNLKKK